MNANLFKNNELFFERYYANEEDKKINNYFDTPSIVPVVSKAMKPIMKIIRTYSTLDETILLTGPSGSGKSRLSEWSHYCSSRYDKPFETVDLVTIPEDMQMAELFGWAKGAFTGAINSNKGAIGRAQGGTLFIDEIDKLSLRAQAGLLTLLETKTYKPLGDCKGLRNADVRFIVATNANLGELIDSGHFREDLYYRINVLSISIPSLKERKEEIGEWAKYMLNRHIKSLNSSIIDNAEFTKDAIGVLEDFIWPGNLRQLDNNIKRAYAIAFTENFGNTNTLIINQNHVKKALENERLNLKDELFNQLVQTAKAFYEKARNFKDQGCNLDLRFADALKGLILAEALKEIEKPKEVFDLFGCKKVIEHRNYNRELRKSFNEVEGLMSCLNINSESVFDSRCFSVYIND